MFYLILDTNIWLNSLYKNVKDNNPIDAIEYWIDNGDVTILLPEIIVHEWENNRSSKSKYLFEDWKAFYNRVKKALGEGALRGQNTPDKIQELVEKQLKRIDLIFESKAIKIPITNSHKIQAADLAISKKQPFGNKNSMGDAYIYIAMIEYIKENSLNNCFFITENFTDFSLSEKERHKVHEHLEPVFTSLGIKYIYGLISFFREYESQLSDYSDFRETKNRQIEDQKLAISILAPEKLENPTGLSDSYTENINFLDVILKAKNPTNFQADAAYKLIALDKSYATYFFQRVNGSIWFKYLKGKGVFSFENNPKPIKDKMGTRVPPWEALNYLERLSSDIKGGNSLELIDSILEIITAVSKKAHSENDWTWLSFIRILSNFPNEKISTETINLIPLWLTGTFDGKFQSGEICKIILPKFLNEAPSKEDLEKAELILNYLFEINKTANQAHSHLDNSYTTKIDLYQLTEVLIEEKFISPIAKYCFTNTALLLADQLKKLLLDYPNGISGLIEIEKENLFIAMFIEGDDLMTSLFVKDKKEESYLIQNYEKYSEEELKNKLILIIQEYGINYKSTEFNENKLRAIIFQLSNDWTSILGHNPIHKLNDRYHNGEGLKEVFSLVFRDLLNEAALYNHEALTPVINTFFTGNKYKHVFFKRVMLYVISQNWDSLNSEFWGKLKEGDKYKLFSNDSFKGELYELLSRNQSSLSSKEIQVLDEIINNGPQSNEEKDEWAINNWKLRWYSALKDNKAFEERYFSLSNTLKRTNELYETEGEIKVLNGDVSPYSVEDILKLSNRELINLIRNFNPSDRWDGPNISGLSNTLSAAVQMEPERFLNELELYNGVYYIYAYHIINGFREARKARKKYDLHKVLLFCNQYISNSLFYTEQLKIATDGWGASSDWVVGAISNLLSDLLKEDNDPFDLNLLPLVKVILERLTSNLKPINDKEGISGDYPTYSLNSTAGKALRALFDYSLKRARTFYKYEDSDKWEQEVRLLFEHTLTLGLIDGYILEGMYFEQFYFLDKDWIISQVKNNYDLGDREWLAFLGGFAFSNPPFNKDIYHLMYPHYERAIKNNISLKSRYDQGLIRHLVAFYFWGYEGLNDGLLHIFFKLASPESIGDFVSFIWRQESNVHNLEPDKQKNFERIITNLWEFLLNKYENTIEEKEQDILAGLSNLIVYVSVLNQNNTRLILKTCGLINKHFYANQLIETLNSLQAKGNPNETAAYIGQILYTTHFDYLSDNDKKLLMSLVTFLYDFNQKIIADKLCDKFLKRNEEFLRETYNKYNS